MFCSFPGRRRLLEDAASSGMGSGRESWVLLRSGAQIQSLCKRRHRRRHFCTSIMTNNVLRPSQEDERGWNLSLRQQTITFLHWGAEGVVWCPRMGSWTIITKRDSRPPHYLPLLSIDFVFNGLPDRKGRERI